MAVAQSTPGPQESIAALQVTCLGKLLYIKLLRPEYNGFTCGILHWTVLDSVWLIGFRHDDGEPGRYHRTKRMCAANDLFPAFEPC